MIGNGMVVSNPFRSVHEYPNDVHGSTVLRSHEFASKVLATLFRLSIGS